MYRLHCLGAFVGKTRVCLHTCDNTPLTTILALSLSSHWGEVATLRGMSRVANYVPNHNDNEIYLIIIALQPNVDINYIRLYISMPD